ncbi:MAG: Histidine--tRNA ligase [Firmicutes bacterium ADurb.Bin300]|nr:MAG: Histidine--tRNA ligase [Firmicutes bacterium ADurb.Bin300]
MQKQIGAIKGARDFLPGEIHKLRYIEQTAVRVAESFGYFEMRTPVFEHTELFTRGVGDTTDVVQKEMYTFDDKAGRSITLRPEGTAGAARAFLEHGLFNEPLPQKIFYLASCYRYEKPQAGRWREFRQFGIECFGSSSAFADAEVISLGAAFYDALGLTDLKLEINSLGCSVCRGDYLATLREYFNLKQDKLCPTCLDRLERNPMRILDCKSPICLSIASKAPTALEFLCADCKAHFEKLRECLDGVNIKYVVNPHIVRGLDYYTRTVFEFISQSEKTKGLVCGGGGRYDGLIEELGGEHIPACGFGLGVDRILLAMEDFDFAFPERPKVDLVLVSAGKKSQLKAALIAMKLRREGYGVISDVLERSVKAQMKYADKTGAPYTAVIGDDELESDRVILKNMKNGAKCEITVSEFTQDFLTAILSDCFK